MLNSLKGLQLDWCFFDPKNCIQESRPSATATHSTVRHLEGVISVSWGCAVLVLTALHGMQKYIYIHIYIWHVILDATDNYEFNRILNGCFREAGKELIFAGHVCRTRLHEKIVLRVDFLPRTGCCYGHSLQTCKICAWQTLFLNPKTTTTTWTSFRCLKRFHVITIGLHMILNIYYTPWQSSWKVVVVRRSFPYSFQGKYLSDCG